MPTTINPPDGYVMDTGVWGIDALRDDAIFIVGASSVNLANTVLATKMYGPFVPLNNWKFVRYSLSALVRADAVVAGANVTVVFESYAADRVTVLDTRQLTATPLNAANTWYQVIAVFTLPATAVWGRFYFMKSSTAFNVFINRLEVRKLPPARVVYLSTATANVASQTITNATWTDVPFDLGDAGNETDFTFGTPASNTAGVATIYTAGLWQMNINLRLTDVNASRQIRLRLVNAASGVQLDAGHWVTTGDNGTQDIGYSTMYNYIGGGAPSGQGLQIKVQWKHNNSGGLGGGLNATLTGAANAFDSPTHWSMCFLG